MYKLVYCFEFVVLFFCPKLSPLWDVDKAKCSNGWSMPKVNFEISYFNIHVHICLYILTCELINSWVLDFQSSEELRREITELETETLQLERYILSLYRTSFGDVLPELLRDDSLRCLKTPRLKPFTAKLRKYHVVVDL